MRSCLFCKIDEDGFNLFVVFASCKGKQYSFDELCEESHTCTCFIQPCLSLLNFVCARTLYLQNSVWLVSIVSETDCDQNLCSLCVWGPVTDVWFGLRLIACLFLGLIFLIGSLIIN